MLNFRFALCISLSALFCAAFPSDALSQQGSAPRTITAAKAGQAAPVIDGLLDDPCWSAADWQGEFIQHKPSPGELARAATRVAVACDQHNLYVAFRCFNPTGPSANSRITRRDGNMDQDNAVTLYLDTFHTRRDCYYFSTNSLGTQVDGRIGEDGGSNDKKWDCSWTVACRADSAGWTAEMAIPVSRLRFPEGEERVWGINFRRNYPEYFETSFWVMREVAWRVSQSGDLAGLTDFRKKFTASLFPYVVGLDYNHPANSGRRTVYSSGGTEVVSGADLRFNLGAAADGNITYNPDFATVEADQDVINLTRYETFYPEKRLYFLEGAELFNNRINVFYSRRIGDIDYGVKSNGRVGRFNYAMLSARERAMNSDPSAQTSVLRIQRDVFGSSNIGLLAVDKSFSGGYNRVLSTDATLYFPSHFKLTSQYVGSFPGGGGEFTNAYFLRLARETNIYHYHLRFTNIDPGFQENVNQVGFIPDDDRRELDSDVRYEWWIKKYGIEKVNMQSMNNVFWSHNGALRNVRLNQWAAVTFLKKWLVGYGNTFQTELFERRYRNHSMLVEGGYNQQQFNSYSWIYLWGRNYGLDYTQLVLRGNFKPTENLSFSYSFRHLEFSPDPNRQSTNLHVLTGDYNFTPNLWLRLFTQYNTRNDRIYIYGLFGWRFVPPFGALYLAYTRDRFDTFDDRPGPLWREDDRAFFVKLTVPLTIY